MNRLVYIDHWWIAFHFILKLYVSRISNRQLCFIWLYLFSEVYLLYYVSLGMSSLYSDLFECIILHKTFIIQTCVRLCACMHDCMDVYMQAYIYSCACICIMKCVYCLHKLTDIAPSTSGYGWHGGQRPEGFLQHPEARSSGASTHIVHLLQPAQTAQLPEEGNAEGQVTLRHQQRYRLRVVLSDSVSTGDWVVLSDSVSTGDWVERRRVNRRLSCLERQCVNWRLSCLERQCVNWRLSWATACQLETELSNGVSTGDWVVLSDSVSTGDWVERRRVNRRQLSWASAYQQETELSWATAYQQEPLSCLERQPMNRKHSSKS